MFVLSVLPFMVPDSKSNVAFSFHRGILIIQQILNCVAWLKRQPLVFKRAKQIFHAQQCHDAQMHTFDQPRCIVHITSSDIDQQQQTVAGSCTVLCYCGVDWKRNGEMCDL